MRRGGASLRGEPGSPLTWGSPWDLGTRSCLALGLGTPFTHGLPVIATPRRELEPLIFFIKMQINLIKSGIVN